MSVSPSLLKILCCPVSGNPLELVPMDVLTKLNQKIGKGLVYNQNKQQIQTTFEEGLIEIKKNIFYPVQDQIPVLLEGESIPLNDGINLL